MTEIEIFEKITLAKQRYTEQRYIAKQRSIEWLFTFETWWDMWQQSGKWEQRGRKRGQWCMGRRGDTGPYSPDNVDIILVEQNSSDAQKVNKGPASRKGKTLEEIHGVEMAQQIKDNLRKVNTGVKQSDATRRKKSESNRGKPWSPARRAAETARKAALPAISLVG